MTALKTKFKNLGFDDKAFDGVAEYLAITVTEDTQIDNGIAGVEPMLKAIQSTIDKRVTDAVAKAKAEAAKLPEPPSPPAPPPTKPGDDMPVWAKGIMERLDSFEKRNKQESLSSKVKAKLAEKKVPESFLHGRSLSVESEADIDNVVAQVETDYTNFRQDLVNSGVIISTPSEPGGDKTDAAIGKLIAEKRNNPTKSEGVAAKKLID